MARRNMYSSQQYIKKLDSFKSYIGKVKKSDDFNIVKERLLDAIEIMLFHIEDLLLSNDVDHTNRDLNSHKTLLDSFKNTITIAKDMEDLVTVTSLLDLLNTENIKVLNEYDLNSPAFNLAYNSRRNFVLPTAYVNRLRYVINNEAINTFFPNCFDAQNAVNFKKEKDKTYGQSSDSSKTTRENLTRLAKGELKGSTISNNFFDALFLVSKVGYVEDKDHMGMVKEPNERIEIRNIIKYLRPNGLFLITIPYTRLLPSLAMYLSKALSNVQVVKVPDDELKRVTIIGTKNLISNTSNPEIYNKLRLFKYDTDAISINDLEVGIYNLPTEELTLDLFRGSQLDLSDVLEASADNMIDSFITAQTDPLVVKDQAPLLPFNIGQVGLVLTSGCLDGVIEEMEGINHVIKGMTTKVVSVNREDLDDNKIKCTETINNQVKINIFTADGKFIQLG